MADDGSSLFCDDDETCEKNVSESEDDGETYVSAPIGKITKAFFPVVLCFERLFPSNMRCCCPARFFLAVLLLYGLAARFFLIV